MVNCRSTIRQVKELFVKQKKESRSITSEKPTISPTTVSKGVAAPSTGDKAGSITIDFHSADFNRIDDLKDNSENYRFFEPLGDVVTADMRHQMEHRRNRDGVDSPPDDPNRFNKMHLESDEAEVFEPAAPLTVISKGRTLIIDTDAERAMACGKILSEKELAVTLLVTKSGPKETPVHKQDRCGLLYADAVSVTGAFGGFTAAVTVNGDRKPLTEWPEDKAISFDLILDLQSEPSYTGELLPMGYYVPLQDPAGLHETLAELAEMRGRFVKPQFTVYLKNRCIHGRSRTRECRHCLEICPFGAIQPGDRSIIINHYLCQGCGACALVCPADAICTANPSQGELLDKLHQRLAEQSALSNIPPTLVITDAGMSSESDRTSADEENHDHRVPFKVEQIGYVGLEMLLAALAYGARKVIVACGPENPGKIREAVEWQVQMAGAILQGLGMPEGGIQFNVFSSEDKSLQEVSSSASGPDARPASTQICPAVFPAQHESRTMIRLTTQHLYNQSGAQQPWLSLPAGSPFGAVAVNSTACTFCMACVVACPSGALSAGGDAPRLSFLESRCHQCGLCEESCPEGAIRLLPRILCDPGTVDAPAVLREVEPFRCVVCDAPFASEAMINRMQNKLAGHWMFAAERQLRRLRMCRTCRARDTLTSEDMKSWNQ